MEAEHDIPLQVIDLSYLTVLSKGNSQFVKEMIRIFLNENPREIDMLEEGIREKDFEKINVAAHKLRSTAPFVGIDKLIEADISKIEKLAVENSVLKKFEIDPGDKSPDIQKIEIVTTDKTVIATIEQLFKKIKLICEKAREELVIPASDAAQ
jgi:HPt (histidine-containing phosphotransfer) domain-containing protein